LSASARIHREKAAPIVGEAQWRPWAKALAGEMSCKPMGAGGSPSLGYTYGSYERRDKGAILEKGFYTRVWRFEGSVKLAVDVTNLVK
jgi:hypothetical protein